MNTDGRVVAAGDIVNEAPQSRWLCCSLAVVLLKSANYTDSCIIRAGCQVEKRIIALGGIAAGIASVGRRNNPESRRGRRKCKRTKRKRDENGSGPGTENGEK